MASYWQQYGIGERTQVREHLLHAYMHLVDYQVQRLLIDLPASVDRDDLLSEGRIGLMDAIERFDPGKNVKFETYASIRIKGALVDYLRKLDWAPRSLRQRARELATAGQQLESELGAMPTEEQLAAKLGLSLDDYRQTLSDLSALSVLSFRDLEEGETEFQIRSEHAGPEAELLRGAFSRSLAGAIDALPERERLVLDLYYRRKLSLKEIGQVLDLSESRICQIHSAAVIRLRAALEDWRAEL
jgi:RNA polymerase sigma factor FliA